MADIFGSVRPPRILDPAFADPTETVPILTIVAKSDRGEYFAHTSVDGTYELWSVPAARYVITLQPPPNRVNSHRYTLDVGNGMACRADFELQYNGSISGSVFNARREGLSGIITAFPVGVELAEAGSVVGDVDNGKFDLNNVPPGRYRLRFLPRINGRVQSTAHYYPDSADINAASVEVGDGTAVDGIEFRIP
jgi:hypothetical protein